MKCFQLSNPRYRTRTPWDKVHRQVSILALWSSTEHEVKWTPCQGIGLIGHMVIHFLGSYIFNSISEVNWLPGEWLNNWSACFCTLGWLATTTKNNAQEEDEEKKMVAHGNTVIQKSSWTNWQTLTLTCGPRGTSFKLSSGVTTQTGRPDIFFNTTNSCVACWMSFTDFLCRFTSWLMKGPQLTPNTSHRM